MIRDRLVVGLRDSKLSERLQLDSDLDLKIALAMARNSGAVRAQQTTVRGSTSTPATSDLAALHKTAPWYMDSASEREKLDRPQLDRLDRLSKRKLAPGVEGKLILALDVQLAMPYIYICTLCKKHGHFASLCKTRPHQSMGAIVEDSGDSSAIFGALNDTWSVWTKKTFIAGTPFIMKLDTGADVTAISEKVFLPFVPNRSWTLVDAFSVDRMENHRMF